MTDAIRLPVTALDVEMPADGTDRVRTFRFAGVVPPAAAWTVVTIDGDTVTPVGSSTGDVDLVATFPGGLRCKWALRLDGQEKIAGLLRTRVPGAPVDGAPVTVEVLAEDGAVTVTVAYPTGADGPPGVVAAVGELVDYDPGTQTITVTTPSAAQVGAATEADITSAITALGLGTASTTDATDYDPTGTAAGRTMEGLLSARPGSASDGARFFAADDRGGTEWVRSSGSWAQAAAPVAAGTLLAAAEPSTNPVTVISVANTDYRVTGLSIDFVMPAQRVLVSYSDITVYQAAVATDPQISAWYSVNGWSAKLALDGRHFPSAPGLAPFYFHRFSGNSVFLPASIPAGASVSVAVFLNTPTGGGTPTLTIDATGNKPHLRAQVL